MKSVMKHDFARVPKASIPRSSFDRSSGHKTSFDGGLLIPIFVDEALPGDTFNAKMTAFARLATPIFPIMDNMHMDFFFFAIPNRLLWENWEKFCGSQTDPGDSIDFTIPIITATTPSSGSMADYLGLPLGNPVAPNVLPFRAYNLVWNEWFRDQNLQDSAVIDVSDGPTANGSTFPIRSRGKRHDYFTSCLPWPQKGDSVDLPLGTTAAVKTQLTNTVTGVQAPLQFLEEDGTALGASKGLYAHVGGEITIATDLADTGVTGGLYLSNLYADLSTATAATINQLRQAFQIQKLLERDARGGTRYTEVIKAHFGVTSPDARLQRPEYLGGGSVPVNISAVAQTQATEAGNTPQGNLAAFGTAGGNVGFTKSFTEHCVILGLVSVRADLTYQQGVDRMWSRSTRYDFYWPALSHIGEQAVLNGEIYWQNDANDALVFGYQERFGEYRYKPSRISGLLRSDAAGSLDAWHLAQDFSSLPVLDDTFIQDTPPIDRVIAVPSEPHFIFDSHMSLRCARPMPMFGVPGLIDHF